MLSEQVLIDRCGNFTASENHRLMAGWNIPEPELPADINPAEFNRVLPLVQRWRDDRKTKPLVKELKPMYEGITGALKDAAWATVMYNEVPKGLTSYAQEKALESLFDPDPSLHFETQATRNGDERELDCIELLEKATGKTFSYTGDDQIHVHANEIGFTADGLLMDDIDLIDDGAEVKCKSPLAHARALLINTPEEMMRDEWDHYVQVQTAMLVSDAKQWHFANFNPYAKRKEHQFKYIIVPRNDLVISKLRERVSIARKIKADFLSQMNNQLEQAA